MARPCKINWGKFYYLLGKRTDGELARLIGCSRVNVLKCRQRLGIASYQPRWPGYKPQKRDQQRVPRASRP
jgi:hypothetical protein